MIKWSCVTIQTLMHHPNSEKFSGTAMGSGVRARVWILWFQRLVFPAFKSRYDRNIANRQINQTSPWKIVRRRCVIFEMADFMHVLSLEIFSVMFHSFISARVYLRSQWIVIMHRLSSCTFNGSNWEPWKVYYSLAQIKISIISEVCPYTEIGSEIFI